MFSGNSYRFRARIQPALITVLPIGLLLLALLAEQPLLITALLAVLGTIGGTVTVEHFGREQGRKKEPILWKSWDGPPTTRMLRHRCSPGDPEISAELRRWVEDCTGYFLPTKQQERDFPEWADTIYRQAVAFLREATRDPAKFPLVLAANADYGFRRNLWGLRPVGATVAVALTIIAWTQLSLTIWGRPWPEPWWYIFASPDSAAVIRLVVAVMDTALASYWLFWIKASWVKTAADEYAQRLLESVQALNLVRRQQ